MKKSITLIVLVIMLFAVFAAFTGCDMQEDDRLQIVVTIFPEYDWVMNVVGKDADWANVTLLLDSGVDLHSYQPSVSDMVSISKADLFIFIGGESDDWVPDALKNTTNKKMHKMNLLSLLGSTAKEEQAVQGMQEEKEEHEQGGHEDEATEYDEHVWLSLKNASYYVGLIRDELSAIDPDHAEVYAANAASYIGQLTALDGQYQEMVSAASRKTVLFGDRFPFRYLTDDYGLTACAAFSGCSAAANASVDTIVKLAELVDRYELKVIFKLESSDGSIAKSIKNATRNKNQQILVLDSLQSSTKKEYAAGRTYLAVMNSNLQALTTALTA
ncbi:MAG TPA: zinc ABC transporter substrate-binding protein [Clostridiales bacterium]|nr:zinc ABC transporter substrate-binding protein [Clostridiales bacterium]